MRIAMFSTKPYDKQFFDELSPRYGHEITYYEPLLNGDTASLAQGCPCVCVFVNDQLSKAVLEELFQGGTRLIALRCAGFNNVDLEAANTLGMRVVRVPAYSPYAVAEHALALMLDLNRKLHRAYNRIREGNFSLDGLLGFDMHNKTLGIVGTGKIGMVLARISNCLVGRVLAYDPYPNDELPRLGAEYVDLETLYRKSDIISLHCPLTPETYHLINAAAIGKMKPGVMLINTSRGAVVDTRAVIDGLKSGKIGHLGLDVYEEEGDLFFQDLSCKVIQDDVFARLMTFPNVIITGHQAFFTREALDNIAHTTLQNIADYEKGRPLENEVTAKLLAKV